MLREWAGEADTSEKDVAGDCASRLGEDDFQPKKEPSLRPGDLDLLLGEDEANDSVDSSVNDLGMPSSCTVMAGAWTGTLMVEERPLRGEAGTDVGLDRLEFLWWPGAVVLSYLNGTGKRLSIMLRRCALEGERARDETGGRCSGPVVSL